MNLQKINKKIQEVIKKQWRNWTILAIFGMIIYLGSIFYQYIYKPFYGAKEIISQKIEIKESVYQRVMDAYFQEGKNINETFNKIYIDIFK